MSLSNFLENALLTHIIDEGAYTPPAGFFVKLHTGDPGEDADQNAAANDERKAISFPEEAVTGGSMSAVGDPVAAWEDVPNTETYSHFSVWDAATVGNPLGYGELSSSASITAGDNFALTSLTWELD